MADIALGNAYDLNKNLLKQMDKPSKKSVKLQLASVGAWLSYNYKKNDYFLLYCREIHDFIIFYFQDQDYDKFIKELRECLETRGVILSIDYSHNNHYYECWVQSYDDEEPRMYTLFNCTDWVVKI